MPHARRLTVMSERPPFHLAFPVDDIEAARGFYAGVLGCDEGRSAPDWADFDLYGHQIVAHRVAHGGDAGASAVDGDEVPVPHFGVVLEWAAWEQLAARIESAGIAFILEPRVRFQGTSGEQGTFFLRDPAGNALEFKTFKDRSMMFRSDGSP
jgi:uncharacterized protein